MNFNTEAHEAQETQRKPQPQIQVVCSGILRNKNGEKVIYVRFERGKDFAEGSIPAAKITSHQGFASEELEQFEQYLNEHRFEIIEQAKTVNLMKNFMK